MKVCPRCSELFPDDASRCPRDGSALRAVLDPLIGKTVGGRYRLISRLGSGGMSSVYLARHVLIDRLMAIKTLRRDLSRDALQRDRFIREARAVNRINHQNIVEITDFGETDDGLVYLVMEYVPGEPLLTLMHEGPIPIARTLPIIVQIARALGRAHQMGVVHRDLKPENVLLVERKGRPDFVKILDFGIAKIMDAPSITGSQQIFGTPGYIAPEYIQSTDIDGRCDLYSLGVLFYEMVTGALPFDYEYPGDLLVKHVTEMPVPPRQRLSTVPEPIEAVILRCLEKEPDARYRDAFHLIEELERAAERTGSASEWGAMGERTGTRARAPAEREEPALAPALAPEASKAPDTERPPAPDPLRQTVRDAEPPAALRRAVGDAPEDAYLRDTSPGLEPSAARRPPTCDYDRPQIPIAPSVESLVIPIDVELDEEEVAEEVPVGSSDPDAPRFLASRDGLLGVRRWRNRFDTLRALLDDIELETSTPPEVARAMAFASRTLEELERAADQAAQEQNRIEALEAEARDFRVTLGKAIDTVGGKLSHARGERDALRTRRDDLRARREVVRAQAQQEGAGAAVEGLADALLWELAAVEEELRLRTREHEAVETQLRELRADLEAENERVETEVGRLVQRLDGEMARVESMANALREPLEVAERFVVDYWDEHPPEAARSSSSSEPSAFG